MLESDGRLMLRWKHVESDTLMFDCRIFTTISIWTNCFGGWFRLPPYCGVGGRETRIETHHALVSRDRGPEIVTAGAFDRAEALISYISYCFPVLPAGLFIFFWRLHHIYSHTFISTWPCLFFFWGFWTPSPRQVVDKSSSKTRRNAGKPSITSASWRDGNTSGSVRRGQGGTCWCGNLYHKLTTSLILHIF